MSDGFPVPMNNKTERAHTPQHKHEPQKLRPKSMCPHFLQLPFIKSTRLRLEFILWTQRPTQKNEKSWVSLQN